MENASKALLIAGGVLIAILILSVLVVTINIINSNQKTREEALATEQLVEFNQKYEAYNKKALRGTDIITLMKMAIENNRKMEASKADEPYFINVVLNLTKEYKEEERIFYKDPNKQNEVNIKEDKISGTYALGNWNTEEGGTLKMINSVTETFGKSEITKTEDENKIIYTYSPFANLKEAIFKCTEVKYKDGRIYELVFTERE